MGPDDSQTPPRDVLDRARRAVLLRRLRDQVIPDAGFADPAWEILLHLFVSHGADVTVGQACAAAAAPRTTALRFISQLEASGRLARTKGHDRRSSFLRLSPTTLQDMSAIFAKDA